MIFFYLVNLVLSFVFTLLIGLFLRLNYQYETLIILWLFPWNLISYLLSIPFLIFRRSKPGFLNENIVVIAPSLVSFIFWSAGIILYNNPSNELEAIKDFTLLATPHLLSGIGVLLIKSTWKKVK